MRKIPLWARQALGLWYKPQGRTKHAFAALQRDVSAPHSARGNDRLQSTTKVYPNFLVLVHKCLKCKQELCYTGSLRNAKRAERPNSDCMNVDTCSFKCATCCVTCVTKGHEKWKTDRSSISASREEKQMWSLQICQVSRCHVCGLNTACREFSSVTNQLSDLQNPTSNRWGPKKELCCTCCWSWPDCFLWEQNPVLTSWCNDHITWTRVPFKYI